MPEETSMLMIRRYDPQMPWRAHQVAEEYSRNLARLGDLLCIGCGALFSVPLTQGMAFALVCILLGAVCFLGHEYRKHVDDVLKHTSMFKLIKIFAPAWRCLLVMTILLGVGLGQAEWRFFAEQKTLLITLFVSFGIFDIAKGYFSSN